MFELFMNLIQDYNVVLYKKYQIIVLIQFNFQNLFLFWNFVTQELNF